MVGFDLRERSNEANNPRTPPSVAIVSRIRTPVWRKMEGLLLKPVQRGEDKQDSGASDSGAGEEDSTLGSQQPEGGGGHDEDAEPCDLAGGSADGVGGDGEAQPSYGGAGRGGLQGAKAAIQADDNGEEAVDVGHKGDRECAA